MHDRIVTPTVPASLPLSSNRVACLSALPSRSGCVRWTHGMRGRAGAEIDVRIEPNPAAVDRPRRRHS